MGAFARGDGGARGGCSGTDERRRRIVGAGPAAPSAAACARVRGGIGTFTTAPRATAAGAALSATREARAAGRARPRARAHGATVLTLK